MKFQIVSLCSITSQCCSDRLSREFSESRLSRDFSENKISFDFSEQRFLSDKNETSFSAQSSRDFEVKVFCKYFESSITSRIFSTKLRRDSPVILLPIIIKLLELRQKSYNLIRSYKLDRSRFHRLILMNYSHSPVYGLKRFTIIFSFCDQYKGNPKRHKESFYSKQKLFFYL